MKRHPGTNITRLILVGVVLTAAACGGETTVASRSAAAYREAQAKGTPVAGGHHGDHTAGSVDTAVNDSARGTSATAGAMDHSAHARAPEGHAGMTHGTPGSAGPMDHGAHAAAGGINHAAMGHGTTPRTGATDHAAMGHGTTPRTGATDHAAMGHGTTPRTGATDHAAMGHGTAQPGRTPAAGAHAQHGMAGPPISGAQHDQHAGILHDAPAAADPHAQHLLAGTVDTIVAPAPLSNAAMRQLRPASTLESDRFDAAAPVAVAEAVRSALGLDDGDPNLRRIVPGQDQENRPTPAPPFRDVPAGGIIPVPIPTGHDGHATGAGPAPRPQPTSPAPAMDHRQHGPTEPRPSATARPQQRATAPKPAPKAAAVVYTCPMHPEVLRDEPGTCPLCGMALVKKQ